MKKVLVLTVLAAILTVAPAFAGDSCRSFSFGEKTVSYQKIEKFFLMDKDMMSMLKKFSKDGWYAIILDIKENFPGISDGEIDIYRKIFTCISTKQQLVIAKL